METIKNLNLGVRFILELCLLIALGFSCFHIFQNQTIKWIAVLGLPILAAVIWGIFVAPKSSYLLGQPYRLIIELGLFGLASFLLYKAAYPKIAIAFMGVVIINEILLFIWKQ